MHPVPIWPLFIVEMAYSSVSYSLLKNRALILKYCFLQIIHMGWVNERLEGTDSSQLYKSKFLALKGSSFYIFSTPPVKQY